MCKVIDLRTGKESVPTILYAETRCPETGRIVYKERRDVYSPQMEALGETLAGISQTLTLLIILVFSLALILSIQGA